MKPIADFTYFLPRLPDDDSKPCLTQSLATCHLTPRPLTSLTFFPLTKNPSAIAALLFLLLRCFSLDSSLHGSDDLEGDRLTGLLDRRLLDLDLPDDFLDDDPLPEVLEAPPVDDCLDNDLLAEPVDEDPAKTRWRLGRDLPGNDLLIEPPGHCLPGNNLLGESAGLDLLDKLSTLRLPDKNLGTASLDDLASGDLLEDEFLDALLDDLPGDHPGKAANPGMMP